MLSLTSLVKSNSSGLAGLYEWMKGSRVWNTLGEVLGFREAAKRGLKKTRGGEIPKEIT